MVDDGCYGWEEVYEACGCSPDYSEPDPSETIFSMLHQAETLEEHEKTTPGEPSLDSVASIPRNIAMTPTLIPSPG